MKICSRFIRHLMMALVLLCSATFAHAVQVTSTWTGLGDGATYTDANNWNPKVVPNNGIPANTTYKAVIDNAPGAVAAVHLNTTIIIDALVVNSGDSLNINNGRDLRIVNSGANTGTIENSGTIIIGSTGSVTLLRIQGNVTLSGGGTLMMADKAAGGSPASMILGIAATDILTNMDNTISGAGNLGQLVLVNRGTIIATGTNPLLINPTNGSTNNVNTGTLRAAGGTLNFQYGTFDNSVGTIEALANSVVELRGPTINGGTLQTLGNGVFRKVNRDTGTTILANITNKGRIEANSDVINLVGTITNSGTFALNQGSIRITSDVTLRGGGVVTMSDSTPTGNSSNIFSVSGTDRLTNEDNTIQGAGSVGNGQLVLTNKGTIVANETKPLVIQTTNASATNVNSGNLRGEGAGGLVVFNSTLANAGGTIEARTNSIADLSGSTINGGTLATAGTGLVQSGGFRTQTSTTLSDVTNLGNVKIPRSTSIVLKGTLTNRGNIRLAGLEGTNGFAGVRIMGDVTLGGGGTVMLDDAISAGTLFSTISGIANNGSEKLTNADNTISGAGQISGIVLINNGTILPTGTNPLLFMNNVANNGLIRVDAGKTLRMDAAATLTQAAGLLLVRGTFDNNRGVGNVNLTGGTLAGIGTIAHNVTNAATVLPGAATTPNESSVGTLTINGKYTQTADGKLFIQIAGPAETEFDRLLTTGVANFNGTLNVQLLGSYDPPRDTEFKIVTYASEGGMMMLGVSGPISSGGFAQRYDPTSLTLIAEGTPTIGVNIQPTQVFTNTVLTATVVTAPSTPVNSVTYDFQVNGVSKQNGTSNTYNLGVAGNGDKNDIITVIATTDDGRVNQNRVTIQNTKPIAQGSTGNMARGGQLLSIPLVASDLDDDDLTFRIVTGVRDGATAAIRAVGDGFVLDYTAAPNFNGSAAIQFVAEDDESNSAAATVEIAVTSPAVPSVNHAPVAFSSSGITVNAGQAADIPVGVSDADAQDTLNTLVFQTVKFPTKGTLQDFFLRDGNPFFRYLPNAGASGTDSFSFTITDSGGLTSNIATISIAIKAAAGNNRAPVAFSSSGITVNAGQAADVIVNVSDPDPEDTLDTLFFKIVQAPTKGTVQNIFLRDGRSFFRYLPNANASGTDIIRYVVTDSRGLTSNTATLSINITRGSSAANRPPVAFSSSSSAVAGIVTDISVFASDPDAGDSIDTFFFRTTEAPKFGTLQSITLVNGRVIFRYRPNDGFQGTDVIRYVVTDKKGLASNIATLSISVTRGASAPNRPPVAFSSLERVAAGVVTDIPVTANDPDRSDTLDTLVFRVTEGAKSGALISVNLVNGRVIFRYQPKTGFTGIDTIRFVVADKGGLVSNTATLSILVLPGTNTGGGNGGGGVSGRAPVAFSQSVNVTANVATDIPINANDPDPADTIDTLTFKISTATPQGRVQLIIVNGRPVIRYTAPSGFRGSDRVTFTATDRAGMVSNVATVTLEVQSNAPVNRAPNAYSSGTAMAKPGQETLVLASATDPDAADTIDTLLFKVVQAPTKGRILGTVMLNGRVYFRFLPNATASGTDVLKFAAVDKRGMGLESNTATITITISNATPPRGPNRAPIVSPPPTFNVSAFTEVSLLISAFDPDGDDFTLELVTPLPTRGTGRFDGNGYFVYTNTTEFGSADTVRFVAIDRKGARSEVATLNITSPGRFDNGKNSSPQPKSTSATVTKGGTIDIPITAYDADGDRLRFSFTNGLTSPVNGMGVILDTPGGPILRYTPRPEFIGTEQVQFQAEDGKPKISAQGIGTIIINVVLPTTARTAPLRKEVPAPSSGNS